MLTKEQALTSDEYHWGTCKRLVGPRGGVTIMQTRIRRNGRTQTWKTRPYHWRIPVKYGIQARDQFSIWHYDAGNYHVPVDCPLSDERGM